MNDKKIEKKNMTFTLPQLEVYRKLREKGRYGLVPNDAEIWRMILDETGGRGLRPFRAPGGGWLELEEFQSHVPPILRNYDDGEAPDCVATSLGMETSQELYNALDDYAFQGR